tara:strand:+ start:5182 stop:5691 length:510 start_codon:yes stop_codon:yes gene_type:complete
MQYSVWLSAGFVVAVALVMFWLQQPNSSEPTASSQLTSSTQNKRPAAWAKDRVSGFEESAFDQPNTQDPATRQRAMHQLIDELEALAEPIDEATVAADAASTLELERLTAEADALIAQMDQRLAAEDITVPDPLASISEEELARINEIPEFKAALERESELEERLEALQ